MLIVDANLNNQKNTLQKVVYMSNSRNWCTLLFFFIIELSCNLFDFENFLSRDFDQFQFQSQYSRSQIKPRKSIHWNTNVLQCSSKENLGQNFCTWDEKTSSAFGVSLQEHQKFPEQRCYQSFYWNDSQPELFVKIFIRDQLFCEFYFAATIFICLLPPLSCILKVCFSTPFESVMTLFSTIILLCNLWSCKLQPVSTDMSCNHSNTITQNRSFT